jgi:hypothetical protein
MINNIITIKISIHEKYFSRNAIEQRCTLEVMFSISVKGLVSANMFEIVSYNKNQLYLL